MKHGLVRVLSRGIAVWLVIIAVETVHGIIRSVYLVPRIGDVRARQISVFVGSLLIVLLTFLFVRWLRGSTAMHYILVGAMWVVLTVGFEIVLGRFAMGLSWERIASDYNIAEGGLMIFGLLVMLLAPLVMAGFRDEI
jgi:hypothetical protein